MSISSKPLFFGLQQSEYRKRNKDSNREPPATKWCPACKETRPSSDFHRNSTKADKLDSHCATCRSKKQVSNCTYRPHCALRSSHLYFASIDMRPVNDRTSVSNSTVS
jgi:hypothetical protein